LEYYLAAVPAPAVFRVTVVVVVVVFVVPLQPFGPLIVSGDRAWLRDESDRVPPTNKTDWLFGSYSMWVPCGLALPPRRRHKE